MCTLFVMFSVCVKFHFYVICCKFVKYDDVPAMPSQKNTNMTQHTMGLMDLSLSTIMFFSILGTQKLVFWS